MKKQMIFDIGANRGEVAKTYVESGYDVIAVEPLSDLCDYMLERFKGKNNFTCVNAIVSPDSGSKTFYRSNADTLSTTSVDWMTKGRFSGYIWQSIGEIDCISIDSLIEKYGQPIFIKIDTEGTESEVIRSLTKEFDCLISVEWVQEFPHKSIDVVSYLRSLNFTEYYIHNHPRGNHLPENILSEINERAFIPIEKFEEDFYTHFDNIPNNPSWGDIYIRRESGILC